LRTKANVTNRSYLLNSGDIKVAAEEIRLATLCIDYLNIPSFERPFLRQADLARQAILAGHYGFMEYAVQNWTHHLESGLSSEPNQEWKDEQEELKSGLTESIGILLDHHWNNPTVELKITGHTSKTLEYFKPCTNYKQIQQAVVSTREQMKEFGVVRRTECALDFAETVADIRDQLESIISDDAEKALAEDLELKYGSHLFKCPRFSCKYFTQGFDSKVERDRHRDRHERPARCSDRNCTGYKIGFATKAQLDRHLKDTHPDPAIRDELFPTDDDIFRSLEGYSDPDHRRI
jgi:hypothetical protein